MTENEAIKIIETEKECVLRNIQGCDRECKKCDLLMEDNVIIKGYDVAISALEEIQQYHTIGTAEELQTNILIRYIVNKIHSCPFEDECGIDFEKECVGFREAGCKECIIKNIDKLEVSE